MVCGVGGVQRLQEDTSTWLSDVLTLEGGPQPQESQGRALHSVGLRLGLMVLLNVPVVKITFSFKRN